MIIISFAADRDSAYSKLVTQTISLGDSIKRPILDFFLTPERYMT